MTRKKRSSWRLLYKFHRYAGLSVALVIILLAVTGIALNHTDDLKLDQQFVQSAPLLDWYGIDTPEIQQAFAVQQRWLSQSGSTIYLDTQPVFKTPNTLLGATANEHFISLAFRNSLLLLSHEGEVIEEIEQQAIQKIGADSQGRTLIQSNNSLYYSDDDFLSWKVTPTIPVQWSQSQPLAASLEKQITNDSRHTILPYERVILDVHSGRFFGKYGVYAIDMASTVFILLAITGTWIWLKHWLKHQLKLYKRKSSRVK